MNDPMTILKKDHTEVKAMLQQLAESEPGAARQQLLTRVTESLELHMAIEEDLLYPLVEREVGDDDADEAEIEHGLARDGLATLHEMASKPGFGAAVEMLIGGITHHVREEEREILPQLKKSLGKDQWRALGDEIAAVKAAPRRRAAPKAAKKATKKAPAKSTRQRSAKQRTSTSSR